MSGGNSAGGASAQGTVGPPPAANGSEEGTLPPPPLVNNPMTVASAQGFNGGAQNFANQPLDSGAAALAKDPTGYSVFSLEKVEGCTLPNAKVNLKISGRMVQLPSSEAKTIPSEDRVLRLIETVQKKSIDTLPHEASSEFSKILFQKSNIVFTFELVTEPEFPLEIILLPKDITPNPFDMLVDLDLDLMAKFADAHTPMTQISQEILNVMDEENYKIRPCLIPPLLKEKIPLEK